MSIGWIEGTTWLTLPMSVDPPICGATDGSLSPAEAEAWAGTDEGRSFYRGAADGWAAASVADGADAAAAARRADATYGFYTGASAA